jgi:hypothetical protein
MKVKKSKKEREKERKSEITDSLFSPITYKEGVHILDYYVFQDINGTMIKTFNPLVKKMFIDTFGADNIFLSVHYLSELINEMKPFPSTGWFSALINRIATREIPIDIFMDETGKGRVGYVSYIECISFYNLVYQMLMSLYQKIYIKMDLCDIETDLRNFIKIHDSHARIYILLSQYIRFKVETDWNKCKQEFGKSMSLDDIG